MLSSQKLFKIHPPTDTGVFTTAKNRWQTRKERSNQSTNNGDLDEIAKRPVSERRSECVTSM